MNLFLTNLSKSLLVLNFIIVTFSTVANAMEINGSQYFLTDENGVPLGVDPDFGSVFVGSTKTQTHSICASCVGPTCSDINYTKINNISMSGSSEFSSTPDSCRQAILVPGKCCSHTVYFAPLSAGTKSASLVLTYTLMNSVTSPTGTVVTPVNDITIVPYTGTGVVPLPISLPPIASTNSCSVTGHSSVNIDLLSLQESIPLVGIPFTLSYSSDRFRKGFSYSTKSLGLGGWSPSVVHRYDYLKHIVYFGNGGLRPIQAKTIAGGYYVSNEAGSELYYFNSNGLHTQTKNAVTGSIIYNFNYDYSGRILSIVDGFGNSTVFEYSGFETTVTSPYGQASILTLDDNGFLASVTNPNKETYQLTNNTSGFLLSFQKPGGQKSVVTYDQNGYVIKDQGAGGDFVSFIRNLNSITGIQNVTSSTALNRQTLFSTSATSSSSSTHVVTTPDGSVRNYSSADQGNNTSTDGYGNVYNSTKVQDPRFNWMAPFESSSVYQVPNSNISVSIQRTQSAQLADSNNPLSVISLSSSVTLQDDSSRVFTKTYDSSQKLLTFTSPLNRTLYQTLNSMGGISSFQNGNLNQIDFSYDNRGRFSGVTQGDRKTNFLYDDYGNLATVTDAVGRTIQYKYDKANRLTEQVLPDGQIIAMTYDANGNRTSITPPGRTAHTFSYNLFESISSYMPPALKSQVLGATTYEYNLDQQLTKVNRPDGTNIIMNYGSASGLLESMDTSGGSYTFQYLPKSNLVSLISSPDGNTLSYQYAGNIPLSVISSGAISSQMQYSYNVDGTLSGMSVSGKENSQSKINISYDKDGLISGVGNISFVLNNVGSINKTSIGQITESIAYDNFGETISDAFNLEKRSLYGISYNRDKLGRIMSIKKIKDDDKKEISYEYDQRGRLTRVFNHKEHLLREYKYDSNGNRIEALTEHGRVKAEYDAQDRLI
ncbi:MAG: hypothetical protein ACXVCP_14585, partial [Bdellovibrio sp.]